MMKKSEIQRTLIELSLFFLIFLVLSNARVGSSLSPFAFGFLFVCLLLRFRVGHFLPTFFIAYLICNFSIAGFVIAVNMASVVIFAHLLFRIIEKKINMLTLMGFAVLSQVGYAFFNIYTNSKIFETILYLAVGLIFIYTTSIFIRAYKLKGARFEYLIDEKIGFVFFVFALVLGTTNLWIGNFSVSHFLALFAILLCFLVKEKNFGLLASVLIGAGVSLSNTSLTPIAIYSFYGMFLFLAGTKNKFVLAAVLLVPEVLIDFFYNHYAVFDWIFVLPYAISISLIILIPTKIYSLLRFELSDNEYIRDVFMVDFEQRAIKANLRNVSEIFVKMQRYYKSMAIGEMDYEEVKNALASEMFVKMCSSCEKCNFCKNQQENLHSAFAEMFFAGLKKKKITLVDLPIHLNICGKPNTILSNSNNLLSEFFEYEKVVKREDSRKILVGDQLLGAGELIKKISENILVSKRQNKEYENKLIKSLLFEGVKTKDCAIFEKNGIVDRVVLLTKKEERDFSVVERVISDFFGVRLKVFSCDPSLYSNYNIQIARIAPRFDVVFGKSCAVKTESEASGDTYSFLPLGDNKFMISLCDGRGSGRGAENISEYTLSIIENFYKAGFDSSTIMLAVNKLLSSSSSEQFSAIDVCIIDLVSGKLEIIKLGSSPTIIKNREVSEIIASENLPLGIIESLKPSANVRFLTAGDVVVLSSDGVYDAFESEADFVSLVNSEKIVNLTMFSENIIEEATFRSGGKRNDDMTVVAFKLMQTI